jgi:hypothetical protein
MVPAASPGLESQSTLRVGDAAGMIFVTRSETLCRLHRPYKEFIGESYHRDFGFLAINSKDKDIYG